MVDYRPIVRISGLASQLPTGDSVVGGVVGTLTTGSGLYGSGNLSLDKQINVALAPNPSGIIFVDQKLGVDGVAAVVAEQAISSGNFSLSTGSAALASGVDGSSLAAVALSSGNAALFALDQIPGGTILNYEAAGAIVSGYAVGLDDTGRVQAVGQELNENRLDSGPDNIFYATAPSFPASTYDTTNNKVIHVYRGTSNYGVAVVGSVSGTSISYGTPVVFNSGTTADISVEFDPDTSQVVVVYEFSSAFRAVVGSVSGSSISFGSPVLVFIATGTGTDISYDPVQQKMLVIYDNGTTDLQCVVGTVTSLSISFGAALTINAVSSNSPVSVYDPSSGFIHVAYRDVLNTNGEGAIISISGTTASLEDTAVFEANDSTNFALAYDSVAQKVVYFYRTLSDLTGNIKVATVTGSNLTFGSAVTFTPNLTSLGCAYSEYRNNIALVYEDNTDVQNLSTLPITISGTTALLGSSNYLYKGSTAIFPKAVVYDPTSSGIVASYLADGSGISNVVYQGYDPIPTCNSLNNFIGVAQTSVSSGSFVQVRLPGSYDRSVTGLTPGSVYYVSPSTSGFSSTFASGSWSGAFNFPPVGLALAESRLLLTDTI